MSAQHTPACHLRSPNRNIASRCSCGAWAHDDELWKTIYPNDAEARERAKTAAIANNNPCVACKRTGRGGRWTGGEHDGGQSAYWLEDVCDDCKGYGWAAIAKATGEAA